MSVLVYSGCIHTSNIIVIYSHACALNIILRTVIPQKINGFKSLMHSALIYNCIPWHTIHFSQVQLLKITIRIMTHYYLILRCLLKISKMPPKLMNNLILVNTIWVIIPYNVE